MLYRCPETDQGKDMWMKTGGGVLVDNHQGNADAESLSRSNTTVWVVVLVAVVVLMLLLGKKFIGKGPENEK